MDNTIHLALLPERLSKKYGERPLLWFKDEKKRQWNAITCRKFSRSVNTLASALKMRGVTCGDKVAIYSQNRPESIIADFAGFKLKATTVPMYATASMQQVKYIVDDAKVRILFVGDQKQYNTAVEVMKNSETLQLVVAMNDEIKLSDRKSVYYTRLEMEARMREEVTDETEHKAEKYSLDDIATLMYTSGTTGNPKGVLITHRNYQSALKLNRNRLTTLTPQDRTLMFLPISHIFERAWGYLCLSMGIQIYVNYNPKDITTSLREVRPTLMCAVPRFWEKIYLGVLRKLNMMTPFLKGVMAWALEIGKKYNVGKIDKGQKPERWLKIRYTILDRLLFGNIRKTLGIEKANFFPVAGSSLSDRIIVTLRSIGIPICYGYGLTESTATVSCYDYKNYRIGSVGRILDGIDVKIGEDDEILIKADTITKGYYNRPEANADSFTPDGYFRTGDAGKIIDRHLYLTERIKDLFKTSNGKYIAPQQIEMRLAANRYIEQAIVIGDKRNYVTAIIVPNFETLRDELKTRGTELSSDEDIIASAEVYRLYEQEIASEQKDMAPFEQIKKFTLIRKGFTLEGGELTNTLKFRRAFIMHKYAKMIDLMYDKNAVKI